MSTGFRILNRQRAVSADLVEKFSRLPVANVSDSMHRMTAAGPRQRADACGFETTEPDRAALARMDALLVRIDEIEARLAKTPARTRAELRIKIEVLSLDGMIRPEFLDDIIADVERLLPAAS